MYIEITNLMSDNPFKILYFRKKKHFLNFQRTFCCYLDCHSGTSHHRNMLDEEKTEMYVHVYL